MLKLSETTSKLEGPRYDLSETALKSFGSSCSHYENCFVGTIERPYRQIFSCGIISSFIIPCQTKHWCLKSDMIFFFSFCTE